MRCGQCEEIFDAAAQLQGHQADTAQAAPVQSPLASVDAAQSMAPVELEPSENHAMTGLPQQTSVPGSPAWADGMANGPSLLEIVPGVAAEPPEQELSFMRGAKPASPWHRPLARAGLLLVSLFLCLGLALQLLVQERDTVAAMEPRLKPWIDEVCSLLECAVQPLRKIDSVVIDSSSFNKIRGEVYRLNFTLKNTAVTELALPAIELTLTDVQDQPVFRRVFLQDELGLQSRVLAVAAESHASLTLGIKTNGGVERIAGYRVLAFYP